jgi:hypothetical protein
MNNNFLGLHMIAEICHQEKLLEVNIIITIITCSYFINRVVSENLKEREDCKGYLFETNV